MKGGDQVLCVAQIYRSWGNGRWPPAQFFVQLARQALFGGFARFAASAKTGQLTCCLGGVSWA